MRLLLLWCRGSDGLFANFKETKSWSSVKYHFQNILTRKKKIVQQEKNAFCLVPFPLQSLSFPLQIKALWELCWHFLDTFGGSNKGKIRHLVWYWFENWRCQDFRLHSLLFWTGKVSYIYCCRHFLFSMQHFLCQVRNKKKKKRKKMNGPLWLIWPATLLVSQYYQRVNNSLLWGFPPLAWRKILHSANRSNNVR